jgi:hypothetical protein
MRFLLFWTILLNSLIALGGASKPSLSTTGATPDGKPTSMKNWTGALTLGRSNSLYLENGNSKAASWDYSGIWGYAWSPSWKSSAAISGYQDLKDSENSDWAIASLTLSYSGFKLPRTSVAWIPTLSLGVPVSRAQRSASFKGSVSTKLQALINPEILFSKKISVGFFLGVNRNIHEFETAASGSVNNQYSSSQGFSLGWNFTDTLAFAFQYTHFNAWTYQGAMKETFSHNQELSYQMSPSWNLALGHSYGDPTTSVWKADRQTYNTNLTDEQNSMVYGQATLSF